MNDDIKATGYMVAHVDEFQKAGVVIVQIHFPVEWKGIDQLKQIRKVCAAGFDHPMTLIVGEGDVMDKPNMYGCIISEDVCMAHSEPLVCEHGCGDAEPHYCKEREELGLLLSSDPLGYEDEYSGGHRDGGE